MLRILIAVLLVFSPLAHLHAQAPQPDEAPAVVAQKEYFIPQQAGEILVVRVAAFEAEFTSRLTTEEGEEIARSGLSAARMLPIYQYVPESMDARQIDIEVSATRVTNRTDFELLTTRLNIRDERSEDLAGAYRLLASGLEVLDNGNVPAWTVKVQTLMRAGLAFEDQGMREMGLWSSVYAAHIILHRLRDTQTARDWAEEILAVPRIERYPEVEFAALKIRGDAMASGAAATSNAPTDASPLQQALTRTAESAAALDYKFEQALALQASGVDLKARGLHPRALEQLEQALEIAVAIGASGLATAIREHVVELHELVGDSATSGAVLQDIESHLIESGENEELARNLLQQGRLYLDSHRYYDAATVLSRALELDLTSLPRLQAELALGRALYESGRGRQALPRLQDAVLNPATGDYREPSTVLDIYPALDALASLHRQYGQYTPMNTVRRAQRAHVTLPNLRAGWAYAAAVDALVEHGPGAAATVQAFQAAAEPAAGGDAPWAALALIRLCALPDAPEARCAPAATRSAFRSLGSQPDPRIQAEASLAYAQLLRAGGQASAALEIAEAQIERLVASGTAALGAWYWQWRESLFENYMGLAIESDASVPGGDASASLLALARARMVERGHAGRGDLATAANLDAFLASMPRDSGVLTWYSGAQGSFAWLSGPNGVRRFALERSADIPALAAGVRQAVVSSGTTDFAPVAHRLGDALLGPVAERLPSSLFVVSHGALNGIPLDALPFDGSPLGSRHDVVYLDAFPPAPDSLERLDMEAPERVFLAGEPSDWTGDFATHLDASGEMEAVTSRFVGPRLNTVRGVALLLDEFSDPRFSQATLAHLSVPGFVQLAPPHDSALVLSEPARDEGRQQLDIQAMGQLATTADLVFFSRTEFTGTGAALENRLGVVSAILDAGAGAAIATLWPVADESRSRIVAGFYDHLLSDGNAATALSLAKRDSIRNGNTLDWASFQLFLN